VEPGTFRRGVAISWSEARGILGRGAARRSKLAAKKAVRPRDTGRNHKAAGGGVMVRLAVNCGAAGDDETRAGSYQGW